MLTSTRVLAEKQLDVVIMKFLKISGELHMRVDGNSDILFPRVTGRPVVIKFVSDFKLPAGYTTNIILNGTSNDHDFFPFSDEYRVFIYSSAFQRHWLSPPFV